MKKFGRVKVSSGVRDLRADIHRDLWDNLLSQTHTRAEDTIIHSITSRSSQAFQNPVLASVSLQIFPTGHNPVPHENDNRFECLSQFWNLVFRWHRCYCKVLIYPCGHFGFSRLYLRLLHLFILPLLKKRA